MPRPDKAHYRYTVGGMFSGIGGLELGLERAGFEIIWHAETDPYASQILAKHWDVPNLGDVTKIDWSTVERPDLVCGGFPCQPVSGAGLRRADFRLDDRWMWPQFARCLRDLRPRFALMENVPGLLTRGFDDVAADLADLRYDFEWACLPAAAVGAPHLRWRLFIVAHPQRVGSDVRRTDVFGGWSRETQQAWLGGADVADADRQPVRVRTGDLPGTSGTRESQEPQRERVWADHGDGRTAMANPKRAGLEEQREWHHRLPATEQGSWWGVEPDVGRMADGVPARVDRLRCLGNAVVPQVAELIGRRILEAAS